MHRGGGGVENDDVETVSHSHVMHWVRKWWCWDVLTLSPVKLPEITASISSETKLWSQLPGKIMIIIIIIIALIILTFWDESTFVRVQLGKLLPAQRIPWSRQKNTSKMTLETKKMVMETKKMMMWKMSTMNRVEDLIFCSASPPPWRAFQSSANSDWSIPLFPSLSACHNDDGDDDDDEDDEDDDDGDDEDDVFFAFSPHRVFASQAFESNSRLSVTLMDGAEMVGRMANQVF